MSRHAHIAARVIAAVLLCAAIPAVAAAQTVLYDIDFSSPIHADGSPPAVGDGPAPRATVSRIAYGSPTVVAGYGELAGQPCLFDSGDGVGDQVALDLAGLPPADFYQLSARLVIGTIASSGSFSIHFDAPSVRTISFNAAGEVRVQVPNATSTVVATYDVGAAIDLRVDVDLAGDGWRIYLDGRAVHSGTFSGAVAIEEVRLSTNVAGNPPLVTAAVDDLVIAIAPQPLPPTCELLDLEDLAPDTYHAAGAVFGTGSAFVETAPLHVDSGPCGGATVSNFARVAAAGEAGGEGLELDLVNINLVFDFGGPVTDVVIPFGEYNGLINFGVNGDCRSLPDFSLLDGLTLGGVSIEVLNIGFPGQGLGFIILAGEVDQVMVGGQDVAVDNIAFCRPCGAPQVAEFEEPALGSTYAVGQSFASGFADFEVAPFYLWAGCGNPYTGGTAVAGNAGTAGGTGREIRLDRVNLRVTSPLAPYELLVVDYGEYVGRINLRINGDCRSVEHFATLSGTEIGGARVFASDYGAPSEGRGRLYVAGSIDEFVIGGDELWIDNLRVCGSSSGPVSDVPQASPRAAMLAQNAPNPFNPATSIAFVLGAAGRAKLDIIDVAGRRVATLVDGHLPAGPHSVDWRGIDDRGRRVASGVYLYRLEVDGLVDVRRMVMLK